MKILAKNGLVLNKSVSKSSAVRRLVHQQEDTNRTLISISGLSS